MSNQLTVHVGRKNVVRVNLGIDVSADTFESEIRTQPDVTSTLIATWTITFLTDGTDGVLLLTLSAVTTADISQASGYMDIKRLSGSDVLPVFDKPLEVLFQKPITA